MKVNLVSYTVPNIELQEKLLALFAQTPIVPKANQNLTQQQAYANLRGQILFGNNPRMPGSYSPTPMVLPTKFVSPPANVGKFAQSGFRDLANAQAVRHL